MGRAARLLTGIGVIDCAAATAVAAIALPSAAQVRIEPVAVSGQTAPGTGGATYGQFLYGPHVGPAGHVTFSAALEGTGVTTDNYRAAFLGRPGALALVARQGDAAPGAGGLVFNGGPTVSPDDALTFLPGAVNGAGEGLLGAYVRSAGAPSTDQGTQALYLVSPAGVRQLVTREGASTPGGGTFGRVSEGVRLNDRGQVTLNTQEPGTVSTAYFVERGGTPVPFAGVGQQAPGFAAGHTYQQITDPYLNNNGQVAFRATVAVPGQTTPTSGLFAGDPSSVMAAVRSADPAPGTDATFEDPTGVLTDSGRLVFTTRLQRPGAEPGFERALYAGPVGAPVLIAAPRTALPNGGTLGSVSAFAANGLGDVAFFGSVFPQPLDPEGAVFLATGGAVRELARSGEAVPGMPGVVFESVGNPSEDDPFDGPVINDAGVMAFVAEIENGDGSNERTAIFAAGPSGTLHLVATSGTQVLIAPGDLRTVSEIDLANDVFPAGDGGVASSLNDANQLVFRAWFTDGSAAILLATVPEPGMAACFVLGGALVVRRRR